MGRSCCGGGAGKGTTGFEQDPQRLPKIDEDYGAWYRLVMEALLWTDKKVENTGTIVENHVHVGARGVSPRNANNGPITKCEENAKGAENTLLPN